MKPLTKTDPCQKGAWWGKRHPTLLLHFRTQFRRIATLYRKTLRRFSKALSQRHATFHRQKRTLRLRNSSLETACIDRRREHKPGATRLMQRPFALWTIDASGAKPAETTSSPTRTSPLSDLDIYVAQPQRVKPIGLYSYYLADSPLTKGWHVGEATPVEPLTFDQRVLGSSPSALTIYLNDLPAH